MTTTYVLWNHSVDRVTARTGKVYRSVHCTVTAEDAQEARQLAIQHDQHGIDWKSDEIGCEVAGSFGDPSGFVSYRGTVRGLRLMERDD
jgi:hypothetical protein